MKSLQIEQDKARVFLNKDIYLKRAVLIACEAFAESCWVGLDADEEHYVVELSSKEEGMQPELIGYEFCNFVLGIMQNV
jgi:hypothetical protein